MSIYKIPQGDHYANILPEIPAIPVPPGFHLGTTFLSGTIRFDETCKYNFSAIDECKTDINKAIGFGYGWYPNAHHKWSIRLGWRVDLSGRLLLYNYSYVNGKRITSLIGIKTSYKFNTEYTFAIQNDTFGDKAIVRVGEFSATIDNFNKNPEWGYILKPYFGGECSAPHDMIIEIKY